MRPTCGRSGQPIPLFGLAPGADGRFNKSGRDLSAMHIIALSTGCVVSVPLQELSPLPLAWFPGPERGRTFLSDHFLTLRWKFSIKGGGHRQPSTYS